MLAEAAGSNVEGNEEKFCTVKISEVSFDRADDSELLKSFRSSLWPGPGTLPFLLDLYEGGDGFGNLGTPTLFSDFASLVSFQGAAVFELRTVEARELVFWGTPLLSTKRRSSLKLAWVTRNNPLYDIRLPRSAFTPEQLKNAKAGQPFLLIFDAAVRHGIESTLASSDYHRIIELENVRVGSDSQLANALQELTTLEEKKRQYELAVQNEAELRQAADDQLASDAKRKEAEQALRDAQGAMSGMNAQEQAQDDKNVSILAKLRSEIWARVNAGTFAGLAVTFVSLCYSVGLFFLGDHQT